VSEQRRDPAADPKACSKCGVHIGYLGDDYCEPCARELGVKPPLRRCLDCGSEYPEDQMEPIDVSPPDEYYPTFEYLCRGCDDTGPGGGGDE
jgi:hypothetical protein